MIGVTSSTRLIIYGLAAGLAAFLTFVALSLGGPTRSGTPRTLSAGPRVCGQPILASPYHYHGQPGPYSSGTPGLPTYGTPSSDFPNARAGVVLSADSRSYLSYELHPDTVYYLLPGIHTGTFMANKNDAFVGGRFRGKSSIISGNYDPVKSWAIDSNSTDGDQAGVTIEYLMIEKFRPDGNAAAINQDSNTGWTIQFNTITLNVPGAGVILGSDNNLKANCITQNGQYGFQSVATNSWGKDALTGGPYNLTVSGNEISFNDTCDFSGLLSNPVIGWIRHNPVPSRYRNSRCGHVVPNGNQGGFKLWQTNGVTIADNYIHGNWGPGIWADTNNANTTYRGNTIVGNEGSAIIEEISYNFSITNNYLAHNGWTDGLANASFPTPALYISESGSDRTFGGVPACQEASCAGQPSYPDASIISGNTMVDNSGSVFLWQSSNRFCSGGPDGVCTMVGSRRGGPFTLSGCQANLPTASIDMATHVGKKTGSPARDWWDGCQWKTENVKITRNVIRFNPAHVESCSRSAWPACGAGGMFSQYGSAAPFDSPVVPTILTFFQSNSWSHNVYDGPSTFYAWNQGNGNNPVGWRDWTGRVSAGDRCSSPGEQASGYCSGPFGQDQASAYRRERG